MDMENSLGELNKNVKELTGKVELLQKKIDPIVEAYDSVIFGKKFLIGLATVVGSLAAVGGGILWLIDYIRHG